MIADDVGADKVGAYADDAAGDYRADAAYLPDTPVIDGLAAVGVRFTDAWADPSCSPARAAIYLGNQGFRTGVGEPVGQATSLPLDASFTTIAAVLSGAGYRSGMFGKWHLGENGYPESFADGEGWTDHFGERFTGHQLDPIVQGWEAFSGTIWGALDDYGPGYDYTNWLDLKARRCTSCAVVDQVEVINETDYATSATVTSAL